MAKPIKIVFGTANFGLSWEGFGFPEHDIHACLEILERHEVRELDTARDYAQSERLLALAKAPERFLVSTKASGMPGLSETAGLSRSGIRSEFGLSLRMLGVKGVDIFYLHSPDPQVPLEETLQAVNELYLEGRFQRFGVSNFKPEDVEYMNEYAASNGLLAPSVYQGNYNAVSRTAETTLFRILRKYKMAYYAYSPLAGGFLSKTLAELETATGRWSRTNPVDALYLSTYRQPSYLKALVEWNRIAIDAGIPKNDLACRWIMWHSPLDAEKGDAFILGASRLEQVERSLVAAKAGRLDSAVVQRIDALWESVKGDAPTAEFLSY